MENKSIYKIICDNMTPEGLRPVNFSIPHEGSTPDQIQFAPGAKDGICVFHTNQDNIKKSALKIEKLLRNAWKKSHILQRCSQNRKSIGYQMK